MSTPPLPPRNEALPPRSGAAEPGKDTPPPGGLPAAASTKVNVPPPCPPKDAGAIAGLEV
jgi:hypothetical protein